MLSSIEAATSTSAPRIMTRFKKKDPVQALWDRYDALQQKQEQLIASRRALLLRHHLLAAMCDTMQFLQLNLVAPTVDKEDAASIQFKQLLEREVELLQELFSAEQSAIAEQTLSALLQPDVVDTIAPCTDPMAYLHQVLSQPCPLDVSGLTAGTLGQFMQESVLSVSIKMHQLQGLPPWERSDMLKQIATIMDRYMVPGGRGGDALRHICMRRKRSSSSNSMPSVRCLAILYAFVLHSNHQKTSWHLSGG